GDIQLHRGRSTGQGHTVTSRDGDECPLSANSGHRQLFNHFIGERDQPGRNGKAEGFRGLEIDHEFKFCRLEDRKIGRFCALEDLSRVGAGVLEASVMLGP
ncbi:MAG: hypothetical protein WAN94_00025, partial [Pseudolabrys sp.]